MASDFIKLTQQNQAQSQIDALKQIGKPESFVGGEKIVLNGTDLSVFQGDIKNFQGTKLGGYSEEELGTIFNALDVNGDGTLDEEEIAAFAAMGTDSAGCIDNDKAIIDENDFQALYEMAQEYVDDALDETDVNTNSSASDNKNSVETSDENTSTASSVTKTEATLSDNEALAAAAELRTAMKGWGTDEATVNRIILESGYNSADIVKIMDAFEGQYGESLMSDIQGDFSGNAETALRETLYNAASQQALESMGWASIDDIPSDIVMKANEFYSELESADATGYMKKFDKLPDAEKAQIMIACDALHPNESAMSRITEDRAWFGKEDGYVRNIISAMRNTAKSV